jgi:hypothetical protein
MHSSASERFDHGCYRTTETQQMIAFWTHTIDTFASVLEHTDNIYECNVTKQALEDSGTHDSYSYMGAVRLGFKQAIEALPVDIRGPVERYLAQRMERCKTIVPEDVFEIDLLLGTKNPFFCSW